MSYSGVVLQRANAHTVRIGAVEKNVAPNESDPDCDPLREWSAAERMAVQAEEMLRTALKAHLERDEPVPTLEMQRNASDLRTQADGLFSVICKRVRDSGIA